MFEEMVKKDAKEQSVFNPSNDVVQNSGIAVALHLCPSFLVDVVNFKPITPIVHRVDQSIPSTRESDEEDSDESPQTPAGTTFDPFAPGPDSLIFAPMKKSVKKFGTFHPFPRKLEFDAFFNANTSPDISLSDLIWVSPSSIEDDQDLEMDLSQDSEISDQSDPGFDCKTPRESTIDTFAPGPEELIFAPKKKAAKESQLPVQRKLDFDSGHPENHQEQEEVEFLEKFYRSILETIISCQCSGTINTCSPMEMSVSFDGSTTTCPGAPVRKVLQTREFDMKICRKLEF